MAVSESILLRRFTENRDSEAFSEIVKRYTDPVYNTCRRILYDEAGAADAAQETFYQLMCNANTIKGSLSGWLHSVATHVSISAIRSSASRRQREQKYARSKSKAVNQWKDISPHIDKELDKLPHQHRDVLMRYFFEGKTMNEIAALERVSQPTISRRINAAVDALRKRFHKKGILISTVVLGALIDSSPLQAAPAVLLTEVGKMSLVGTATGALASPVATSSAAALGAAGSGSLPALSANAARTAASAAFSTVKAKVATAVAITAIGTGAVVTYNSAVTPEQDAASEVQTETVMDTQQPAGDGPEATMASTQPIVLNQMYGGGGYGGARAAGGDKGDETPIKLTDPETTIDTFTELLVTDNLDRWAECFVPGSPSLVKLKRIMTRPQTQTEQQLQNALNSVGHPVETLDLTETENGLAIKFLYTVYDPISIEGDNEKWTWQEGDQFEVDAELVKIDQAWKIANISIAVPL